jgi:hypothetical protein
MTDMYYPIYADGLYEALMQVRRTSACNCLVFASIIAGCAHVAGIVLSHLRRRFATSTRGQAGRASGQAVMHLRSSYMDCCGCRMGTPSDI